MKMLKEKKVLLGLSPLFATPCGRKEYRDTITAFERAIRADEREKCAKVAETFVGATTNDRARRDIARAIRGR